MALTLLVYRAGEVIKRQEASPEGKTTVTIDGLESNTQYNAGEYKLAWTDGKLESDKVDVPEFMTNKIGVKAITATPETVVLNEGQTQQISSNVTPSTADDKTLTYSSNNQPVATVTQNGLIEGVSKGQATITVKSNDNTSATAKVKVTVNELPKEEPEEAQEEPPQKDPVESPEEVVDEPDTAVEGQPEATDSESEATEDNPDTVSDDAETSLGGDTEETVNRDDASTEEEQTL